MVSAELSPAVDDGTLNGWVELARQMVGAADGLHHWRGLLYHTTVSVTANNSDYQLPAEGSDDPDIDKILGIRGQLTTDLPLPMFSLEYYLELNPPNEFTGVTLVGYPDKGKQTIRFFPTPSSAKTFDVWVKQFLPSDSLDFVKAVNHDVFYWATLMLAYKKDDKAFPMAKAMYNERLQAAIANDWSQLHEYIMQFPVDSVQNMKDQFLIFQSSRP